MTDYYDGPRGGIADYEGRPHVYCSIFSHEQDDYTDIFQLSPISRDVLELALEDWRIWLRWEKAFYESETTLETHPALPGDRQRHDELAAILQERVVIDLNECVTAHGEFRARDNATPVDRRRPQLEVNWTPTGEPIPHTDAP